MYVTLFTVIHNVNRKRDTGHLSTLKLINLRANFMPLCLEQIFNLYESYDSIAFLIVKPKYSYKRFIMYGSQKGSVVKL